MLPTAERLEVLEEWNVKVDGCALGHPLVRSNAIRRSSSREGEKSSVSIQGHLLEDTVCNVCVRGVHNGVESPHADSRIEYTLYPLIWHIQQIRHTVM